MKARGGVKTELHSFKTSAALPAEEGSATPTGRKFLVGPIGEESVSNPANRNKTHINVQY
jgi:hypothetical protein